MKIIAIKKKVLNHADVNLLRKRYIFCSFYVDNGTTVINNNVALMYISRESAHTNVTVFHCFTDYCIQFSKYDNDIHKNVIRLFKL